MSLITGFVIKKIADRFVAVSNEQEFILSARGKVKQDGVFVGDKIVFDKNNLIVEKVEPRKNLLVRPSVANLQQLIIVIAPIPKPDFRVVDKLILFCLSSNIKPILCVNKTDLAQKEFLQEIEFAYSKVCKIVFTSVATLKNLEELHSLLKDNISAFAGQSATGKSSLLNAIYKDEKMQVGELSKKIARGKNTTRHVELFCLEKNTFLADTPGFSRLDENYLPINYFELASYYPDFLSFAKDCKYKSCTHSKESLTECSIKQGVKESKLDKGRYERYLIVFEILKQKWVENHG